MLPAHRVIGHKEYAAGRKSDPVYDMNWRRNRVAAFTPRGDDDMAFGEAERVMLNDVLREVMAARRQELTQLSGQVAGLNAALNVLAGVVASGRDDLTAEELRAVIREEMANVVDVQVTVRDGDESAA